MKARSDGSKLHFRLDGETWRMIKTWHDDVLVRAEPFDAIELDLTVLWSRYPHAPRSSCSSTSPAEIRLQAERRLLLGGA
jgi:hypothetical protein